MESERFKRIKKTAHMHLAVEVRALLKKIEEDFPDNPASMTYFYELFREWYNSGTPLDNNRKIIGTICIQVPHELIYASGAMPLRLCNGSQSFEQVGAEFLPAKSCSIVKATTGMLHISQHNLKEKMDMVVVPTTCDQKKKAAEIWEDMGFNIYTMEVPPSKDTEEARFYWQNSVKKLVSALQKITGERITKRKIRDAIGRIQRASDQYRKLYGLMESSPPVLYGKDLFLVTNAYAFDNIDRWTNAVKTLNRELERKKRAGEFVGTRHAPRILFTGSPPIFPNLKIPLLVEQAGAIVVTDEVCSSSRVLYDAVVYDEGNLYDMIPAIADRYLKPSTCPFFTFNSDRRRKLIHMAERFAIDGVVYQAYAGCQLYEMEQRVIGKTLMSEGIPMLYIETDYSPEDIGQLSTRVEAFIESIKARKRRK